MTSEQNPHFIDEGQIASPDDRSKEPNETEQSPLEQPSSTQHRVAALPHGLPDATADRNGSPEPSAAEQLEAAGAGSASERFLAWKERMRHDFETCLASVEGIPDTTDAESQTPEPDLYAFYEQLATAIAEFRKTNRRTAEALSQWGETLARFDEKMEATGSLLCRQPAGASDEVSLARPHCLSLLEFLDRMRRIALAFQDPPRKSWWSHDDAWRKIWENQQQAFDFLVQHFEELLSKEGIRRIKTIGQPFDPAIMSATAVEASAEQPHNTVVEEFAPGYFRHGELLRPAQVKVIINKTGAQNSWEN